MAEHHANSSLSPIHVPLHTTTLSLTGLICTCSILYGLMTHENVELMGVRRDLTPLYLSLGPSWLLAPLKLLFSQFVCLSSGELLITVVCVSCSGRLDRLISFQRLCGMFAALLVMRLATIVIWCAIVAQVSLVEVRVRPSALWICVSVYVLRACLCRSQGQLLLGRVLPVNAYPMQHVVTWLMVWSQSGSLLDTTLPAALSAGLLCTELVGIHRWSWADALFNGVFRAIAGGRRLSHCVRKSISFPPQPITAAARNQADSSPQSSQRTGDQVVAPPSHVARRQTATAAAAQQSGAQYNTQELVAMGFSEVDSRAALSAADGDVNLAAVWLLEGRQLP